MITVQQASEIIGQVRFVPGTEKIPLTRSTGRVLAEKVSADRDLPPFHRSTMDGIAISFNQYESGLREFVLEGTLAAGQPQSTLRSEHGCFEIMTGAVLPEGTDTVVRYEDITIADGKAFVNGPVEKNQSVHRQGIDAMRDEMLLAEGTMISPAEVALLASVGKSELKVYSVKPVAIVSTGDELVPVEATPERWQVRRSNGVALSSALTMMHIDSKIFHLPDEPVVLEKELRSIVDQHEIIILSGGVSKGKFDYVPVILEKLGIKKEFHQVRQRPGKPFWFGRSQTTTVFALPGNPVSTFLCFHRYIRPWIVSGLGMPSDKMHAAISTNFTFKPDLTYFLQVKIDTSGGLLSATPDPGEGSGDFANLRNVDGFIELPAERSDFRKGEVFPFISFRK